MSGLSVLTVLLTVPLERYRAVFAGRTEDGIVAEKRVARPFFAASTPPAGKAVGTRPQRSSEIGVVLSA